MTKPAFEPEPGDFEVVPMGGYGGKLIRIGEFLNGEGFRDYEHARLYLGDGIIVEAQPSGARLAKWNPDDRGKWSTGLFDLTAEQRSRIVIAGHTYVGVGYSEADYFALAAYRLKLGLLVPGLKAYVADSKHMICSQLVDQCYQDAGVQLFDDKRWPGYVTPESLANLIFVKEHLSVFKEDQTRM